MTTPYMYVAYIHIRLRGIEIHSHYLSESYESEMKSISNSIILIKTNSPQARYLRVRHPCMHYFLSSSIGSASIKRVISSLDEFS
jgi:hypothetical protein